MSASSGYHNKAGTVSSPCWWGLKVFFATSAMAPIPSPTAKPVKRINSLTNRKNKVDLSDPPLTHSPPKLTSRPIRVTGTFLSLALSLSWTTECEHDTYKKASTCPVWKQPTVINTLPLACAAWCLFSWHFLTVSAAPPPSRPG